MAEIPTATHRSAGVVERSHPVDRDDPAVRECRSCGCRLLLTVQERRPDARPDLICYACDVGLPCDDPTRTRSPFRHR